MTLLAGVLACARGPAPQSAANRPVIEVAPDPCVRDPPSDTPPAAIDRVLVVGQRWQGRYVCPQGETELRLEIVRVSGASVAARFVFHHVPSDAAGSYSMEGLYDAASTELVLAPVRWIERPPDYLMVGLSGRVSNGVYSGRVSADYCGDFRVELVGRAPASGDARETRP